MNARTLLARAALVAAAVVPVAAAPAAADDLVNYKQLFNQHVPIPDAHTNWVPQGLAYWKKKDALIISYYYRDPANPDAARPNSQIWIVKRSTGKPMTRLTLDDNGHAGGLAVTDKYLYIASSDARDGHNLHAYRTSKLLKAGVAPSVGPQISAARHYDVPIKGSYMGQNASGTRLFIGDFDANKVQRYKISGAAVIPDGAAKSTPGLVQGVGARGGRLLFSTSYGNDKRSTLYAGPFGSTTGLDELTAPNMTEGVAFAKGRAYVLSESSANYYTAQSGTYVTDTIDSALLTNLGY